MKNNTGVKKSIICPDSKQFISLIVCAATCKKKCRIYQGEISYEFLVQFVQEHPEYEIIGELMAQKTKKTTMKKDTGIKEKLYWVTDENNVYKEIPESEILNNPQEYFGKKVWEKPPYEYEIIVSIKKKKN